MAGKNDSTYLLPAARVRQEEPGPSLIPCPSLGIQTKLPEQVVTPQPPALMDTPVPAALVQLGSWQGGQGWHQAPLSTTSY